MARWLNWRASAILEQMLRSTPGSTWRIGDAERRTLVRIAELARDAFLCAGLPEPILEPWVAEQRPKDSIIIDMAHTAGTTRMSENPRSGVVDSNCRIHGVDGLYVAGSPDFSD